MWRNPTRPTAAEVAPLILDVWAQGRGGCCCHVIVDDGNSNSAEFCLDYCDPKHLRCLALALHFCAMTPTQIGKATKLAAQKRWRS